MTNGQDHRPQYSFVPGLSEPNTVDDGEAQDVYALESDDARDLADLLAIQQDLTFVGEACQTLLELVDDETQDRNLLVERAFWTAAVIAYARCFATGKRGGLAADDLDGVGGDGAREFHQTVMAVRNKHIAHSVNPFELIEIGVMVGRLGTGDETINGLVVIGGATWAPSPATLRNLIRLVEWLMALIATRLEERTPAVLESAQASGAPAIRARRKLSFRMPGGPNAGSPRPY
jgi:hypothetical protein